jgi:hypothetical protein
MLQGWLTASSGSPLLDLLTGMFLMALPLLMGVLVLYLLLREAGRENRELQDKIEQLEQDRPAEPDKPVVEGEADGT